MGLMPTQPAVSHDLLAAASAGLETHKKTIDDHIAAVRSMLGTESILGTEPKRRGRPPNKEQALGADVPANARRGRKRRRMNAAARKRLGEPLKKRWAAAKRAGRSGLA